MTDNTAPIYKTCQCDHCGQCGTGFSTSDPSHTACSSCLAGLCRIEAWSDVELVDGPRAGYTMALPTGHDGSPPARLYVADIPERAGQARFVRDGPYVEFAHFPPPLRYVRRLRVEGDGTARWLYEYEPEVAQSPGAGPGCPA